MCIVRTTFTLVHVHVSIIYDSYPHMWRKHFQRIIGARLKESQNARQKEEGRQGWSLFGATANKEIQVSTQDLHFNDRLPT